jgi:hypothetical protein
MVCCVIEDDGLVTIVTVAVAVGTKFPRLAVTVPELLLTVPWVVVAELNVKPAGNMSVTTTFVAVEGPLF